MPNRPDRSARPAEFLSLIVRVRKRDVAQVSLTGDNLSADLKRLGPDAFAATGPCPGACSPCPPRPPTTLGSRVGSPFVHSLLPRSSWPRVSSAGLVPTDGSTVSSRI